MDGYIWSGGSEVANNASGASTFGGYLSGYLIAATEYETVEPFTRIFRVYGKDADLHDVTIESGGTMYFRSGAVTDLKLYSGGAIAISATTAGAYVTTLTSAVISGSKANATLRHIIADSVNVISGGSVAIQSGGTFTNLNFLAGNGTISGAATQRIDVQHMVVSGAPVTYTKEVSGKTSTYISALTTATVYLRNNVFADDVTVNSGAMLRISSGATVTNLHAYGNTNNKTSPDQMMALVEVSGGALVSGGDAQKLARVIVRAGGTAVDLEFHTSTHYYVHGLVSGGSVHTANFDIRGGTVRETVVDSGGTLKFGRAENGQAVDVTIGSGGSGAITSGGTMTRTLVSGGAGTAVVHVSSGAAVSTTLVSNGSMIVSKLAWYTPAVTSTFVSNGGLMTVLDGVASDTFVSEGGSMLLNGIGEISATVVSEGGKLTVSAGNATDVTVSAGGLLGGFGWNADRHFDTIADGTAEVADNVTITGDAMTVGSDGVAAGTIVAQGGVMTVQDGGTANGNTLLNDGSMIVSGVVSDTVVSDGGSMLIDATGKGSATVVSEGGKLTVAGNATDVTVSAGGLLGGFAWNTDRHFDAIANGTVEVAENVAIAGEAMTVGSDGVAADTIVSQGGVMTVEDGGSASGIVVSRGGSMTMSGGNAQNLTVAGAFGAGAANEATPISGAAHLNVYGGTVDSLTVAGVGGFYGSDNVHDDVNRRICAVISGGTVNSLSIADAGYVRVSGATVNNVTMSKGSVSAWCYVGGNKSNLNTRMYVYAGGVAYNVEVEGTGQCEVFVRGGGIVSAIDIKGKGYFGAYVGGTIKGGVASGTGGELQGRGGMISGVTVRDRAYMFVSTGTVKGNEFISGGALRLGLRSTLGATVAESTFISGGYGTAFQSAWTSGSSTFNRWKYTSIASAVVSGGAVLKNSLIGDGALVRLVTWSGAGIASNVALLGIDSYNYLNQDEMMMARLNVSGGCLWKGGDVLKHAQAIVYSGGSAEGITMGSGAHVYVSANATVTDMVVDGVLDFGLRGGTAENTLIKKGSMTVSSGVASGTILSGGTLRIMSTGAASDTTLSGGVLSAVTNGTIKDTTVLAGGYAIADRSATWSNANVSSGGSMRIYASGGTIVSGLTAEAGAVVYLDFIRAANGSTNIDSLANVNAPVTILNWSPGNTYTLAETGNANLEISINYQGFYNEFGAGETYLSPIYGGREYTLDAEGKTLSIAEHSMSGAILTTEAADLATSGAFLTGYVNSDDKAIMWADVNLNGAVTFVTSAANIAGDAWIDLDRTKGTAGATIYGAEGNCMSGATIRYLIHGAGSVGNFAGGATAGGVVGGVELVGHNTTYSQTYLGGMGTVQGLVSARVSSGNTLAKDFYAGALANYAKTGTVTSVGGIDTTIALNMSAGTTKETKYYAKGNIYGASQVKAGTVTTAATVHSVGDVVLTINNGETTKDDICIFAAGYATGSDAAKTLPVYTVDSVTATISGGNWGLVHGGRGIFGGAFAGDNIGTDGVWAQVGDVNLTISGGTMGNVYGGGWAQKGAKSEVGDVNLTIKGGTIANVFGGGTHSTSGGTTVAGNVTITVSGGTISNAIYARGQLSGDSTGAAEVIFTGAKNFSCGVYGYSYVEGATGTDDEVTLSFSSYAGTFSGKVGGFNGITFGGNTTMTLGTAADDVKNTAWTFDTAERYAALAKSAFLDWSAADFTGDTIAVNLATGGATEWDLVSAASTTVYNKFDVLVDGASILTETIDLDEAIVGGAYAGWGFTLEDDTLKFKHLA